MSSRRDTKETVKQIKRNTRAETQLFSKQPLAFKARRERDRVHARGVGSTRNYGTTRDHKNQQKSLRGRESNRPTHQGNSQRIQSTRQCRTHTPITTTKLMRRPMYVLSRRCVCMRASHERDHQGLGLVMDMLAIIECYVLTNMSNIQSCYSHLSRLISRLSYSKF